jgi:ubiquinone/menaquinone biosynthesis C-methylase UbiE
MKEHEEKQYWSRFADSYDRDGEYVVGKSIIQAITRRLSKNPRLGNVIEFGCGTGYFTKTVAKNAKSVVATDLSERMLEVARVQLREYENISIEKADCRGTSFPAESFDTVLLVNLIHVVDCPAKCLRESHRILRTGGSLIVVDFTGYGMSLLSRMRLGAKYLKRWGLPPRRGRSDISPDELMSLAEGAGFHVEDVQLLESETNALYLKSTKT